MLVIHLVEDVCEPSFKQSEINQNPFGIELRCTYGHFHLEIMPVEFLAFASYFREQMRCGK